MKRMRSTFLAALAILLSPMAANAVVIDLAHPSLPLIGESGPFGFGGRGIVFRADDNFTMNGLAMEGRWDGMLDLGVDVYAVAGPGSRALISSSTFADQIWSGDPFTMLSHTESFLSGLLYEVQFRFSDPGLIFPHYNFHNPTLDPAQGYMVGPYLTVLDGCDFDTGQCTGNVWTPHFLMSVGEIDVPEPGTLALLGIGLFGMGLARRRKV